MKLQAPKGTRDFYPQEMAWRSFLTDAWREVSTRNGFEQVDGPIYETLDLYKVKSGDGIVSELFHFEDRGERELAIRPEFTPTLARMVAAKANSLPRPIKWFATPNLCRAEKPQRGRLREHWQWNIDLIGVEGAMADAEVLFTAIDFFKQMGLTPEHVRVKLSHRETVRHILTTLGVAEDKMLSAFDLLDRRDKISAEAFVEGASQLGLDAHAVERFEQTSRSKYSAGREAGGLNGLRKALAMESDESIADLLALDAALDAFGISEWCEYDLGIVRGLAYYTGMVFEVHEKSGAERAVAGGGRYDKLIELFGGPSMPAVGFGMGDVVISLVLSDKGLMPADDAVAPKPAYYVIAASDNGAEAMPGVVTKLRSAGLHVRFSYKSTRNVGKLMKDATASGAAQVIILDDRVAAGIASVKNLANGEQEDVPLGEIFGRGR